jgi:hypothetical protein
MSAVILSRRVLALKNHRGAWQWLPSAHVWRIDGVSQNVSNFFLLAYAASAGALMAVFVIDSTIRCIDAVGGRLPLAPTI